MLSPGQSRSVSLGFALLRYCATKHADYDDKHACVVLDRRQHQEFIYSAELTVASDADVNLLAHLQAEKRFYSALRGH